MKNLKIILSGIAVAFFLFLCFYLMGSFYNTSFNLKDWDEESRALTGVIGGLLALIIGGACIVIYLPANTEKP